MPDHLWNGLAEGLQTGGLAGGAQVVVLAAVAHLHAVAPRQVAEERIGPCDQLVPPESVVGAEGTVGHDRDPRPTRAQDGPAPLLERPPASPPGDGPAERDEVAMAELHLPAGLGHAP